MGAGVDEAPPAGAVAVAFGDRDDVCDGVAGLGDVPFIAKSAIRERSAKGRNLCLPVRSERR